MVMRPETLAYSSFQVMRLAFSRTLKGPLREQGKLGLGPSRQIDETFPKNSLDIIFAILENPLGLLSLGNDSTL